MEARKLLCLTLFSTFVVAALMDGSQDDAHYSHNGGDVTFLGRSAKFDVTLGVNSTIRVSFGAIQELASNGSQVHGHKIVELASLKPSFQQGYMLSADATNVTYVKMHLPLNATGLQHHPAGCQSPVTEAAFEEGYLDILAYFGFENDTLFTYGYNNTLVAPANTLKFSIEALNWPFCDLSNTLQLDIVLKTGAGQDAKPRASNHTEDATTEPQGTVTRRMRKLLGPETEHGNGKGSGTDNEVGNSNHSASSGHGRPSGPRDPRVEGYKTDRVALLLNKTAAMAATLDLESYAYNTQNGTQLINVTSTMLSQGQDTIVRLSFPSFSSIFYDPTLDIGVDASSAGYTSAELTTAAPVVKNSDTSLRSNIMVTAAALLLVLVLL